MNTEAQKKNLAELKASMDNLKQKYQDQDKLDAAEADDKKMKFRLPDDKQISNLRQAIHDYLKRNDQKKNLKKE